MMKKLIHMVLLLAFPLFLFAQDVTVKGTVVDEDGTPLIAVNVTIQETPGLGDVTDLDGNFTINTKVGNTLVFSYIGYKTTTQKITAQTQYTIVMPGESEILDEVVVIGSQQGKKETSVGAVTQAKGEELIRSGGATTVSSALQGLLPGVIATNSNSKPGQEAADLLIRGKASWQGSGAPLTLVDGVERSFDDVDPNEIETISVLKDASATSVFGTRGANGVILITTRRGKLGKPVISFTSNFGFKQPTVNVDFADQLTAMEMFNEAAKNDNLWGQVIPESTMNAWRQNISQAGPNNQYFPQVDWWNELVRKVGYSQNYNLNLSGGTNFMKYFASLGYLYDGDIYNTQANEVFDPRFYFKRYNWRSNFDFNVTPTTEVSVNIAGKMGYRNSAGFRSDGGGDDQSNFGEPQFFQRIYTSPSDVFPIRHSDGTWGEGASGEDNVSLFFQEGGQRFFRYYEGFYDLGLNQKLDFLTKGLKLRGKVSYNSQSDYASSILRAGNFGANTSLVRYYRQFDYSNPVVDANGNISYPILQEIRFPSPTGQEQPLNAVYDIIFDYGRKIYYELGSEYNRGFGKHNVAGLVLWNRNINTLPSVSNNVIGNMPRKDESLVGGVTYKWNERYLMEVNGAYMGSDKFGPGQRYGFFPSMSFGWRISEEPFIKNIFGKSLTNLKARYSWGQVGSDQGASRYTWVQKYTSGNNVRFGSDVSTSFGPLYLEGEPANVNATWETSTKQNAGVDFELFGKFSGVLDFFKEERTGILMSVASPFWGTPGSPDGNIGETKNRGFEVDVRWNDRIGKDFRYTLRATYSFNQNRTVFRNDPPLQADYLNFAGKPIGVQNKLLQSGYYGSLDDIFNYSEHSLNVNRAGLDPGDFMYVDYNADGVINSNDQVPMQNALYPFTNYGGTVAAGWKGFDLNLVFYGVKDVAKNFDGLFLWDFPNNLVKAQPNVTQRWTAENPNAAEKPTLHLANSAHNKSASNYIYQDATFIRLKSMEVSYVFPTKWLKPIGLSRFLLYVNGNNLITISNLDPRLDPETNGAGVFPIVRRYNVGFRTSF